MIVQALIVAVMLLVLLALLYGVTRDRDHFEAENRELRNMLEVARMLIVEFRDAELDERALPKVPPATLSMAGAWLKRFDDVRVLVVLLALMLVGCADRRTVDDACDVKPHLDPAGHLKECACVCDDDEQRCNKYIPDCWRRGVPPGVRRARR